MAFKSSEELEKEAKERGYWTSDMAVIKRRLEQEEREWIHRFDSYIDCMIHGEESLTETEIVRIVGIAEKLADLRAEVIRRRHNPSLDEEE